MPFDSTRSGLGMSRSLVQGVHSALDQGDHGTARALIDLGHACICLGAAEARVEEAARVAAEAAAEQQRVHALKTQAEDDRAAADRAGGAVRKADAERAAAESRAATVRAEAAVLEPGSGPLSQAADSVRA
ncbi:hypothetical protein ACH4MA_04180 [Streptomyces roseolus]|uniref:hypothetical protein n=1 Tax=Streptomyces roseolus TaxID=67358 RepID=UPI00378A775A